MRSGDGVSYYVKLSDGDVQRVSLDELDAWFQAGSIDARTMVLASDGGPWTPLGQLAGLDEEAPPVRRAPPVYVPPPLASHRPVSIDLTELAGDDGNPYGARQRGSRGRKGWTAALVGMAVIGGLGSVVAFKQPAWAQPYWSRLARATGIQAAAGSAIPAPVFATSTAVAKAPPAPASQPWVNSPSVAPPLVASVPQPVNPAGADPRHRPAGKDTVHIPKGKANRSSGGAGRSHGSTKRGTNAPFTTGGSKYDPLNTSI